MHMGNLEVGNKSPQSRDFFSFWANLNAGYGRSIWFKRLITAGVLLP
jgi:hypothetical protein